MLFRRRRFDRELKEELQTHLTEREADYVREGFAPAEARRRAAIDFGNHAALHEQSRDVWLVRWFENIKRDARIAVRMLRSAPGFAAAAIATLALGIGATTAIFTLVDALLLRPLPYSEPERLVHVTPGFPRGALLIFREHGRHFAAVGGYAPDTEVTWTSDTEPVRINAAVVSGDLFPLLGVRAEYGRVIEPADEKPGAERAVVISHAFWQRSLGGAPDAVGGMLRIEGEPRRILGVMPASFHFPSVSTDIWIAARINPADQMGLWASQGMQVIARLAPGATLAIAQADVPRLAPLIRDGFPWRMPDEFGLTTVMVPLQRSTVGQVRSVVLLLSGAVALVLLIACANVATLLLARSESRASELALRGALGAGRGRLAAQLMIESGMVAALGAAVGLLILWLGLPAMVAALPPDVPRLRDLSVDLRVLSFATTSVILTTMLIGLLPAARAARLDPGAAIRGGDARAGQRTRAFSPLVTAEVGLALVLVAGAAVLLQSLVRLSAVDPGFDPRGLESARVHPIQSRYQTPEARAALYRSIVERASAAHGVTAVAAASEIPLAADTPFMAIAIEDHPVPEGAAAWTPDQRTITPDYFRTMGIAIREGRSFDDRDGSAAPGVVIVNESMARRYWPGRSAISRRVRPVWQPQWRTIVGVVADVRNGGLADAVADEMYMPHAQNALPNMTVVAQSTLPSGAAADAIKRAVRETDPQAAVSATRSLEAVLDAAVADRRFVLRVLGGFALVALALGAIGIYGVTAYGVARRGREIGLRLALGATRRDVIAQLAGQMARPISAGLILGLIVALGTGRLLRGMVYQSSATDPIVLGTVVAVLGLTALVATLVPALRASRVDPATALRQQ